MIKLNSMSKKVEIKYSLSLFLFHCLTAIVYGFGVYCLKERGFSSSDAGLLLASSSFCAFIMQAFLSDFSDKSKKVNAFGICTLCALIIFVFSIFNYLLTKAGVLLAIVFVVGTSFYITLEPFVNTLNSKFTYCGININYSRARSFGSISYAIFCFLLGKLTNIFDYKSVLLLAIVDALFLLVDLGSLKKDFNLVKSSELKKDKDKKVSFAEFVKNNKNFTLLMLSLACLYYGYLVFDNFMILLIEDLGGSSNDLGSILGFKAVIECFGIFFLYPFLSKKIKLNNLLLIGAFAYLGKAVFTSISFNIFGLYASQLIQCLSFAIMYPGVVELTNRVLKESEITRGQAFVTMACVFGAFFSSSTTGIVADNFGIDAMKYIAIGVTLIGVIGYLILLKKVNPNG